MRFMVLMCCALLSLGVSVGSASANQKGTRSHHPINWQQRDTALYVVSTINVLRTTDGRAASSVFPTQLQVIRYNVLADLTTPDLFFIKMRRDDGSVAGILAYKM